MDMVKKSRSLQRSLRRNSNEINAMAIRITWIAKIEKTRRPAHPRQPLLVSLKGVEGG
jgi:hypothetical protein